MFSNPDFVYTLIGWFTLIMMGTLGAAFWHYKRGLSKAAQNVIVEHSKDLKRIALTDRENTDLQNKFIEHEAHKDTKEMHFEIGYFTPLLHEVFVIKLRQAFESVEPVSIVSYEGGHKAIYKITNGESGIGYLRLQVSNNQAYVNNDILQPCYKSDKLDLAHYTNVASEQERLELVTSAALIIPIENNDEKIWMIQEDCIEYAKLEYIGNEYSVKHSSEMSIMHKLVMTQHGLKLRMHTIADGSTIITPQEADLMYSDVNIAYNGKDYLKKPSVMMKVIEQAAKEKKTIQLYGTFGTGKTRVAHSLAATLSQNSDNVVIYITPSVLNELDTMQNQAMFMDLIREKRESRPETNFFLFLDEAETALKSNGGFHTKENSFLLQFMDGVEKSVYNISLIMTFNANPKDLNQALFRSGRAGVIVNMEPITEERAHKLVAYLKTKYPEKIFQPAQLAKFLNEDSAMRDGTIYAPKGFTTIADVMACFVTKEFDKIMNLLDGTTTEVEKVPVPVPAVSPSNRVRAAARDVDVQEVTQEAPQAIKAPAIPTKISITQPLSALSNKKHGKRGKR